MLQGPVDAARCVALRKYTELPEDARPWPADAMLHPRNQIKPRKTARRFCSHFDVHALEVVDGVERRYSRIVPAGIDDQLACAASKGAQVGVDGVEGMPGLRFRP